MGNRLVGVSLLRVGEWVNKPVFVQGKGLLGRGSNTERITLLQEYTRCLISKIASLLLKCSGKGRQ